MNKAERIHQELMHEAAAIWYISDEYGSKIMIKVPTTSIKSLLKGCKIELLFGRNESSNPNIFHTGLKIYDDPLNYQMLFCTHRYLDEHFSIAKILALEKVQVQLYNELNVCQAFGELVISEGDRHNILTLLGNPKKLYTGVFSKQVEESLDNFQNCFVIPPPAIPESLRLMVAEVQIIKCESIKNYIYHERGVSVDIDIIGNEGEELEKEVFAVLYSLFNRDTIRNPRIPYKSSTRELTDILAFSELGIFLFETKALSIIKAEEDRTMERKVAGLKKQINKAINQLTGAMKRISENTPVLDADGNEILFNRALIPHGVILVSELLPFGDWEKIIITMFEAMIESNSMIHIMDMREFMQFIGYSKGNKYMFDDFLVQRANHFVKNRTLFQSHKFSDRPSSNNEP